MEYLGSPEFKTIRNDLIFSTNVCHGGDKFKLHYHHDTHYFHCYTDCQCNYNIFELIQKNKDLEFSEAVYWLADFVGKYPENDFVNKEPLIEDWVWLDKYKKLKNKKNNKINKNKIYDKIVLNQYFPYPHIDLLNEGINYETQKLFNIQYDLQSDRILIPAYTKNNELLGCKGRIIKELETEDNRYIGIIPYNKSYLLWGLQHTYPYILENDKIILFESEKSVMKAYQTNEFKYCASIGGHSISPEQIKQSINISSELIIAFDKDVEGKVYKELINKIKPYCKLSIIWDNKNLLQPKNSPIDQGVDIFKKLYNSRYKVN